MIPGATGIILAGGDSRRFGSNKALAPWGSKQKLVEKVCSILRPLFRHNLVLVKDSTEFEFLNGSGVTVCRDQFRETHVLGGICSGLRYADTERVFVCGCDMPYLQPRLVRSMWEKMDEGYCAVIPVWQSRTQSLCGFYSKGCLGALQTMVKENRLKVRELFGVVRTRFFQPEEIRATDPLGLSFLDIDSPEDYRRAREQRIPRDRLSVLAAPSPSPAGPERDSRRESICLRNGSRRGICF